MAYIEDLLERICRNMIKALLTCLDNATKATIYNIGPVPSLQAVRKTSGIRLEGTDEVQWGLPAVSDYNYPGKSWEEYKDRPDHVLEAMGWCVEKQKSWTAENPYEDVRSVRKQLRGEPEDFYHMEPVLVKKRDLYRDLPGCIEYPVDWHGAPIWQDTEFVVAAVIKIHFLPHAIRRDDRSTRIIRELSMSLGTELLSVHLRENLLRAQREFTRQRLESCAELAHELRNTFIKFGFVFSAINAQIGILRQAWEDQLKAAFPELVWKETILDQLSQLVRVRLPLLDDKRLISVCESLLADQAELSQMSLLPDQEEVWFMNRIWPRWQRLFADSHYWDGDREDAVRLMDRLKDSLRLGQDPRLPAKLKHLPMEVATEWARLAYTRYAPDNQSILEDILRFLATPSLPLSSSLQIKKSLKALKVLVEVIPEMEEKANRIILSLRYGNSHAELQSGDACSAPMDYLEAISDPPFLFSD